MQKGTEKRLAIANILKKYIKDSKKIRFEGDNYSQVWQKEAARRGLSNIKDTPRALDEYLNPKSVKLYEKHGVLVKRELEARNEIRLENYILKIQIEARVMGDLILNHIIPTAINYQNKLLTNAKGLKELGVDNKEVVRNIKAIGVHIKTISTLVEKMVQDRRKINKIDDQREKAIQYCDNIKGKYFDTLREAVDALEFLVDDEDWPLVKYRELLFLR
jgi:glutamine synthetase